MRNIGEINTLPEKGGFEKTTLVKEQWVISNNRGNTGVGEKVSTGGTGTSHLQ